MATKYVCDGCGCERSSSTLNTVDIKIHDADAGDTRSPSQDLCNSCLRRFENNLPSRWPRAAKS